MRELIVLVRAEAEALETQARLEDVSLDLGDRFNARVEEGPGRLERNPECGSVCSRPCRGLLVGDFPLGIFYCVEGRRMMVQAVLDLQQDPRAIRRRLGLDWVGITRLEPGLKLATRNFGSALTLPAIAATGGSRPHDLRIAGGIVRCFRNPKLLPV